MRKYVTTLSIAVVMAILGALVPMISSWVFSHVGERWDPEDPSCQTIVAVGRYSWTPLALIVAVLAAGFGGRLLFGGARLGWQGGNYVADTPRRLWVAWRGGPKADATKKDAADGIYMVNLEPLHRNHPVDFVYRNRRYRLAVNNDGIPFMSFMS